MQHSIQLNNKFFERYISENEIKLALESLAVRINKELDLSKYRILIVLDGSFVFGADIIRLLQSSEGVSFVKLSSYIGTESTGDVAEHIGLGDELKGKNVLILEDIVDTGTTLDFLLRKVKALTSGDIKIASMFFKPKVFNKSFSIDYIGMEIEDRFVVGYGLDYEGKGRELKEVYSIINEKKDES